MQDVQGHSLAIGWAAVRANRVPMAVLWLLAVALAVGYYTLPVVEAALEPFRRFQSEGGCLAAFANRFFFCGVIPGIFLFAVKSIRPRRPLATAFAQGVRAECLASSLISSIVFRGSCSETARIS